VTAAAAKSPIRLAGNACLVSGDRFDYHFESLDQRVEFTARFGITSAIHDEGGFKSVGSRDPRRWRIEKCAKADGRLGFATTDRDERRRIDNHRGRPSSP
jgi:hypothetical protein